MITIQDLKIQPTKLNLVIDQWKQYCIIMIIAIIILVMDMTKTNLVMLCTIGYVGSTAIAGMCDMFVLSLHKT